MNRKTAVIAKTAPPSSARVSRPRHGSDRRSPVSAGDLRSEELARSGDRPQPAPSPPLPLSPSPCARRSAFTLLEVILALALTALVLVAIGMAVDSQLRLLDRGRAHAEEAQLARVILHRIADDLRNAVRHNPLKLDANGVPTDAASAAASDLSSSSGASTSTGSSGSGTGTSGTSSSTSGSTSSTAGTSTGTDTSSTDTTQPTADPTDVASSTVPQSVPGVYGNFNAVQVDVSRLPRIDQLVSQSIVSPDGLTADTLSDMRSVTYFVVTPQSDSASLGGASAQGYLGLVRREINRATASSQSDLDGTLNTSVGLQQVAPEVAGLEFEYFDGTQWTDSWDTNANGGLPMAIRIRLYLFKQKGRSGVSSPWQTATNTRDISSEELLCYQLSVHLPGSEPCTACANSSSTDTSSSDSSSSASGSSSGTGASSGSGTSSGTSKSSGSSSGGTSR